MNYGFFDAIERFCKEGETNNYHNFILSGKYYRPLKAFTEDFPHIKMILFENFHNQIKSVLKEIYDFLVLNDRDFLPSNLDLTYNASGIPRNKFFNPVFNFLFRENQFKDKLKRMVPINQRQKIKTRIANSIIARQTIPENIHAYLQEQYKMDVAQLAELFDQPDHREIVLNWVR
jgi:hypothetical protein